MGNAIVTRIIKTKDFTTMSNHCFKNKNLSYKAKGMLAAMLSFPDGWNFSVAGLAGLSTDGESSVKSALNELKKEGYVKVYAERDERGQISKWHYDISEVPLDDENPDVENPDVENPHVDNQPSYKVLNNDSTYGMKDLFNEDNSPRTINSTSKNISSSRKNSKKEFDLSFVNVQFEETFKKWLRYKEERKEMYKTQMTLEENYRRLLNMANNDPWTAQQIVDYTISGGWMGYCMPKQQNNYGNNSTKTQQPVNRYVEFAKTVGTTDGLS